MRYGYANLGDVGELSDRAQRRILKVLARLGADVIAAVECGVDPEALPGWQVVGTPGPSAQLLFIRPGLRVFKTGAPLSTLDRHGMRIRARRFPWAIVEHGDRRLTLVGAHMPPRRMPVLDAPYERRLRRILGRLGPRWVVAADWNAFIREDPARLRRRLGAKWYAKRIDGFAVSPALPTATVLYGRRRASGHFWALLEL